MNRIAIHIVDDDADVRDGLAWLFDSRGYHAATWSGGDAFLHAIGKLAPDWDHAVVLMDIRMEPLSGLATFERLQQLGCPWPVLFLTGHGDVGMAVAAVKKGAWDFLEKPFQDNLLVDRIEQALAAASALRDANLQTQRLRAALASLSQREREVLAELIRGHYNKTIADHLGITQRTVEFHRANIFNKLGVQSAIELAHQLGRLGAVSRPEINMRSGAGTQHEALWVLSRGYPLEVLARKGKWLKVRDFENDRGWVYRPLTNAGTPHHVVKVQVLNIRSAPSLKSRVLAKAAHGEILKTLERKRDA